MIFTMLNGKPAVVPPLKSILGNSVKAQNLSSDIPILYEFKVSKIIKNGLLSINYYSGKKETWNIDSFFRTFRILTITE